MFVIHFGDGTTRTFTNIGWITTFSQTLLTRQFDGSSPARLSLTGPGESLIKHCNSNYTRFGGCHNCFMTKKN